LWKLFASSVLITCAMWSCGTNPPAPPPTPPTIVLRWSAAPVAKGAPPVANYEIFRSTRAGAEGAFPYVTVGNVLSDTDAQVVKGVTYYYRIAAKNSAGSGPLSPEIHATAN
jgi:hypothetical protein